MSGDGHEDGAGLGQQLIDAFLAARSGRTRQAYAVDLEDFAAYLELPPGAAVARLLAGGAQGGRQLVKDYAVELRLRRRAPKTVSRRLGTLRTFVNDVHRAGTGGWVLDVPVDDEIEAAAAERRSLASYLFPRHPAEIDRLDVQHYALREALGANHVAPVESPERVLDAGSGTGQWGFEMCALFPAAQVVGLDLVRGKPGGPSRYRFVMGNLLQGLPFRDGLFDLVHQRFLVAGLPLPAWPAVVADLVRATRPGGWVELVEAALQLEPAGPATRRLLALAMGMAASLGLDTARVVADSVEGHLRDAGLEHVSKRDLVLPVGEWGGRTGVLMATDIRSGFTRACEVLHARQRLPLEEGMALVNRFNEEIELHRTTITCAIAVGRRRR